MMMGLKLSVYLKPRGEQSVTCALYNFICHNYLLIENSVKWG